MKSERLPRKALLDIYGKPLIIRLFQRLEEVFDIKDLVVCTSTNPQDDELQKISDEYGINCFRGSELDVMGRFIEAANNVNAQTIARVTGDNPLTDPKILKDMFDYHIINKLEYTYTNDLPVGTRAEIIDINALKRIHKEISDPDSIDSELEALFIDFETESRKNVVEEAPEALSVLETRKAMGRLVIDIDG